MKKFIGTKVIKAMPMTMVEAQKVLGREIKPATKEDDGYLVEYKDGYKSWSPKSVFEEAYKPAETFLDRLLIEKEDLLNRIAKLIDFLSSKNAQEKVGCFQFMTMKEQLNAMDKYLDALNRRIFDLEGEGITCN